MMIKVNDVEFQEISSQWEKLTIFPGFASPHQFA